MNIFHCLTEPYYARRPSQIWRRLLYECNRRQEEFRWVELPWGLRMFVSPADDLGHALCTTGINDLMVSESIFRLLDQGETAVDVGANIGYTTSVMAARVAPSGKVLSFEPHPRLFEEISRHVSDWQTNAKLAEGVVKLFNAAVSQSAGWAMLIEPEAFLSNRGRSRLEGTTLEGEEIADEDSKKHSTRLMILDEVLADIPQVGLLKVDVEGHEKEVFAGAAQMLGNGRVRDIVFEEFDQYPAETHRYLESHGYNTFVVEEDFLGPQLLPAHSEWKAPSNVPPNYVATIDPLRLEERFQSKGWCCLKGCSHAH